MESYQTLKGNIIRRIIPLSYSTAPSKEAALYAIIHLDAPIDKSSVEEIKRITSVLNDLNDGNVPENYNDYIQDLINKIEKKRGCSL